MAHYRTSAAGTPPVPADGIVFAPIRTDSLGTPYRPFRFRSDDGLILAGRDHPAVRDDGRPAVIALPGLTRNSRDFEPMAARLTRGGNGSPARRLVTFDLRGRGASAHDPDPSRYSALQELADTRRGLALLGLDRVSAFGSSRGGVVALLAGHFAPGLLSALILNDIGPAIEERGLRRLKVGVGRALPADAAWDDFVTVLTRAIGRDYPRLDRAGFERLARRMCRDVDGHPVLDYDPALAQTLVGLTPEGTVADLWTAFASVRAVPTLVVRGGLSEILSAATVAEMAARHPGLETFVVPDEGHTPLFEDDASLDGLVGFLDRAGV